MKKRLVRLTESDLHKIIKESVKKTLNELDWRTYMNASNLADKKFKDTDDKYLKAKYNDQSSNLYQHSLDRSYDQYGLNFRDAWNADKYIENGYKEDEENGIRKPSRKTLNGLSQRSKDFEDFLDGNQRYNKDKGQWETFRQNTDIDI